MSTVIAPLRVIIADDTEPILTALAELIGDEPELDVVGLATNGAEAVDTVLEQRPDVTVMDMRMPELDGLRAAGQILAAWPQARILMHSAYDDPTLVDEADRIGAVGYLVKSRDPFELIEVLLGIARTRDLP